MALQICMGILQGGPTSAGSFQAILIGAGIEVTNKADCLQGLYPFAVLQAKLVFFGKARSQNKGEKDELVTAGNESM